MRYLSLRKRKTSCLRVVRRRGLWRRVSDSRRVRLWTPSRVRREVFERVRKESRVREEPRRGKRWGTAERFRFSRWSSLRWVSLSVFLRRVENLSN